MLVVQIHDAFALIPGIVAQGQDGGWFLENIIAEGQEESEYEGIIHWLDNTDEFLKHFQLEFVNTRPNPSEASTPAYPGYS